MRMTTWIAALAFALAAGSPLQGGIDLSAWKNQQEISFEKAGLVRLALPIETMDAARGDFADLRLVDSKGAEVPFALDLGLAGSASSRAAEQVQTSIADGRTIVTCSLPRRDQVQALWIETPASEFIKPAKLEASSDGRSWTVLRDGQPIFRERNGASNLRIEFPAGVWARFRITLDDARSAPIPVSGVRLQISGGKAPSEPLPLTEISRVENAGRTRIILRSAAAHVSLAEMTVETPEPAFTRRVTLLGCSFSQNEVREVALAEGMLSRQPADSPSDPLRIGMGGDLPLPSREFILLVENQDSPPLALVKIAASRRVATIVAAVPAPGSYRLLSGNLDAQAPSYDLASLSGKLSAVPASSIPISPLQGNPLWRAGGSLPEVPTLAGAIDVKGWNFRKPVRVAAAGIQQLELDPELLSRTRSNFGDLRLVSGDRQVPYVLERTSLLRDLEPAAAPVDDPKRPKVSRWSLKLPLSDLPIVQLTAASRNNLFRRSVRLLEEVSDERGIRNWDSLGAGLWVRTSSRENPRLALGLDRPPRTDRLVLEVDNGDNPPLELTEFQAWYPATRLLFKAASAGDLYLYYGNPKAGPPDYDIGLVAAQILAAEKAEAKADAEESLGSESWNKNPSLKAAATPLFWVVLVIVVAGLIFVLAKLLPAKPAA